MVIAPREFSVALSNSMANPATSAPGCRSAAIWKGPTSRPAIDDCPALQHWHRSCDPDLANSGCALRIELCRLGDLQRSDSAVPGHFLFVAAVHSAPPAPRGSPGQPLVLLDRPVVAAVPRHRHEPRGVEVGVETTERARRGKS